MAEGSAVAVVPYFPPSDVKRLWPGVSGGVAGLCIRMGVSFFSHVSADFFRTFEA